MSKPRERLWAKILVLAVIVAAIYLPTLQNGFVYDSEAQVLNDPFIHDPGNWADVLTLRVLSRDVLDFNRPANLASLMADSLLWRKNPFGYHLTNLLLHLCNCALLFVILLAFLGPGRATHRKEQKKQRGDSTFIPVWLRAKLETISGTEAIALAAALFFGLHPLNVEAVAEVAYREDLLVAFFSLLGLLILILIKGTDALGGSAQSKEAGLLLPGASFRSRRSLACCVAAIGCFFLAAASKETGMLTPLWLATLALLFKGSQPSKRWPLVLGGAAVAVGLFTAARFLLAPEHSAIFTAQAPRLGGSVQETLLIQTRIWAAYFRQIGFPMDLCADYGPYSLRNFTFIGSLLALLGVGAIQIFSSLRCPLFAFGAVTFWFFLLPASNLLPMFRPMADRFLYFPMIGVALMLASWLKRLSQRRLALAALACAAIVPLAARTLLQERIWRDGNSLWKATLETNPASITALNNLAGLLAAQGKPKETLELLAKEKLALRFQNAETFAVKAIALDAMGRQAQADAAFKTAIQLDPHYAQPALLVQGLTWNRREADKLQIIANRN